MTARMALTEGTLDYLKFTKQWPARSKTYMRHTVWKLASKVEQSVGDRLPADAAELGKSLQLAQVSGPPAYLVWFKPAKQVVSEAEQDEVILEVVLKRGPTVVPPKVQLLAQYGPWTLDTLPYVPSARHATVVKRRVSTRAVRLIREARKREFEWRNAMSKAGVPASTLRKRKPLKVTAISDLRLQSITYEFGLAGVYKPHWRPAILKKLRGLSSAVKKDRKGLSILNDPSFTGYKNWPPKSQYSMNPSNLKQFEGFQEQLGIL